MKKTSLTAVLITLLLAPIVLATDLQTQPATSSNPARVETQILKTIVFIEVDADEPVEPGRPEQSVKLWGTGFLVSVPDSRLGKNASFTYLVTNRHVAQAIEQDKNGNCVSLHIRQMHVRLNLKEPIGGRRLAKLQIPLSGDIHWFFPKDEASDLAVIPFGISDKYDLIPISSKMFLTEENLNQNRVGPGDKVLTGGFYSGYMGLHEIQPILREGVMAMRPDGPMLTTLCKPGVVYLADVHVIPGNSGSPIFIIPSLGLGANASIGGLPDVFGLLGVISGYMYESEDFTLRASTTWKGSLNANSGISVVVPAQQLKELLDCPDLQRQRDEVAAGQQSH